MKKIKAYILISVIAVMSSCNDFLTEEPKTQFNKKQIYGSASGAQAALNSCYAYLSSTGLYGQKLQILLCGHSGTMTVAASSAYLVQLAKMEVLPNNDCVNDVYTGSYQTINAINDVIINLADSPIDEAVKSRIMGEAHFLRAVVYFNLVRIFGPVPLVDRLPTTIEEAHIPRTPIGDIYELILSDLDKAWDLMPEKGEQPYGRSHKYAAKALQAKVYVAMACIKENPGEPFDASWLDNDARDYWQQAYDIARDVKINGGYTLTTYFAELWDCYNKYTPESIFELEMNYATGSCSFMYHYLPGFWEGLPETTSSQNYGRLRGMRENWDEHYDRYPEDYRRDVTYLDSLYYRNMKTTSSPGRLYYTYPYTKENPPPGGAGGISRTEELPYIKKYVDPRFTTGDANVNVIVLRYGDLLLTLAEAANELDKTAEAAGYVNELMQRARRTPSGSRPQPADWPATLSKEQMRDSIMVERRLELKAEFHEWFDVRRKGKEYFTSILQRHNDRYDALTGSSSVGTYDYKYDLTNNKPMRNMLCPFPASEISSNNSITDNDQNYLY